MPRSLAAAPLTAAALLAFTSFLAPAAPRASAPPPVYVFRVVGVIDPINAGYVARALKAANRREAGLAVLEIDTPGGLDTAMRDIDEAILASRVPVAVYVSPSGARAASAGVYIAYAAQVIAMAPSTSIGAAHPVDMQGNPASDKITNDAASYLRALAARRGRSVAWADSFVRRSASLSEREAQAAGVADVVAADRAALLAFLDGRRVARAAGDSVRLVTAGAPVREVSMGLAERLLHVVAHPNVAYLLFILGLYGLIYEFANPGINFSGILGAVCLALALVAFQAMDASFAGVLLLLLSLVLFTIDLYAPTHGVLTAGGILTLLAGSLLLFRPGSVYVHLSLSLVIAVTLVTAAFLGFAMRAGWRAQRLPPVAFGEPGVGMSGEALTDLAPAGVVLAGSEQWSAIAEGGAIRKGARVTVLAREGLKLRVAEARPPSPPQGREPVDQGGPA